MNFLLTLTYTGERITTHGKGLDFKRSEVLVADYSKIIKIIKNRPKNAGFCQKTSRLDKATNKEFLRMLRDEQGLLDQLKDKTRFELNHRHERADKKTSKHTG